MIITLQVWSDELAGVAQNYADTCVWAHNAARTSQQTTFNYVGENIAITTQQSPSYSGLVGMWDAEKQDYDYDSNTCAARKSCGHYTQVSLYNIIMGVKNITFELSKILHQSFSRNFIDNLESELI